MSKVIIDGVFSGMDVDVFDKTSGKWVPGTVLDVTKASSTNVRIKVEKVGQPIEFAVDM